MNVISDSNLSNGYAYKCTLLIEQRDTFVMYDNKMP